MDCEQPSLRAAKDRELEMEPGEFADVCTNVFAWYLRLLEEVIQEKNLVVMEDFWHKSQILGVRGVVMRQLINKSAEAEVKKYINNNPYTSSCLWPNRAVDKGDVFLYLLNIKRLQHLQVLVRTRNYQELLELVKDYHYAFIFRKVSLYLNKQRTDPVEDNGLCLCAYLRSLVVLKENSSVIIKYMLDAVIKILITTR